MIVGTAGHIDHGKTALVRALTGVDTDRLPEEKRRGITIELGFAPLELPGVGAASVVDVPGHEAFVRTMVAGATGIDVALLVVAADEGVMPQTREHIAILDLLGVQRAVVALTKADLCDAAWIDLVANDVGAALAATSLATAPCLPVSAVTGAGLDALRAALAAALRHAGVRNANDIVRLPIDRVFTKSGTGTVVTGTLWSGSLALGDEIVLLPNARRARVRGLQTHGAAVERADAGARVAVALAGIDFADVERGDTLVRDEGWTPSTILRADVQLLPDAPALTPRSRVRFHLGTREVTARVVSAGARLEHGGVVPVRVALDAPVVARGGDRFVLRRPSPAGTIGGGVITDVPAARRRVSVFARSGVDAAERLQAIVGESALTGVAASSLPLRLGLSRDESSALLAATPAVVCTGELLVARDVIDRAETSLLEWLGAYHRKHPAEPDASLEHARASTRAGAELNDALFTRLTSRAAIIIDGPVVRRGDLRPPARESDPREATIIARLTAAAAAVPTVAELERDLGPGLTPVLRRLEREGRAVALESDRFALTTVVQTVWEQVAKAVDAGRTYSPSELRSIFGVSRQYLMPWLEYFDRRGYCRREPTGRRFRPNLDRVPQSPKP